MAGAARRLRAAAGWRHGRRRLRSLPDRLGHGHDPARIRQHLHAVGAGARGSPALRPCGQQVVRARSRLLVGAAGVDADDRRRGPAGGLDHRRRLDRRRLAPRRAVRLLQRLRRRRRRALRRDHARRRPRRPRRVSVRAGADRRRVARDQDAALPDRGLRHADDRDHPLQRWSPRARPLRHRLRRQRRLCARAHGRDRQQPAGGAAVGSARRRRGLAPDRRLRPLLDQSRSGPGEPDRRRPLADLRPRRLRLRRQAGAGPRHRRPRRSQRPRPRRLHACALAAGRGGQRFAGLGGERGAARRRRAAPRRRPPPRPRAGGRAATTSLPA